MNKTIVNYVLPLPTICDPDEGKTAEEKRAIQLDNYKKFGIYITFCELLKALSIVEKVHDLRDLPFARQQLPKNLFSWKQEHFMERRKGDMVWAKTLETILPTKAIDAKKMLKDFSEMLDFMKRLMELFLEKHPLEPIKDELLEAEEFLAFDERLRTEISQTKWDYNELADNYVKFLFNFRQQLSTRQTVWMLKASSGIEDAIEFRYTLKYYENLVEQEELYCHQKEYAIKECLERINQDTKAEIICFQNKMGVYDDMIDDFETRKSFLLTKYDNDLEDININIQKTNLQISKLNMSRKYYEEQLERYKDELEQRRLKEIELAEEAERAEAEAAQLKSKAKTKKTKLKK